VVQPTSEHRLQPSRIKGFAKWHVSPSARSFRRGPTCTKNPFSCDILDNRPQTAMQSDWEHRHLTSSDSISMHSGLCGANISQY